MKRVAIYTEGRDLFVVLATDMSNGPDDTMERFALHVVRTIRHDSTHGIRYENGDDFDVSMTKDPDYSRFKDWNLDFLPITAEDLA